MKKLAAVLAFVSAGMGAMLFFRPKAPAAWAVYGPRLLAGALAPFNAVMGVLAQVLGLLSGAPLVALLGGWEAFAAGRYIRRMGMPHQGFEQAFGAGWEQKIPPERRADWLKGRRGWHLPQVPQPRLEQDVPFAVPAGPGGPLLCDVWSPPVGVSASGLAFIYMHGGAWYLMDKDVGTRPLFRYLAAQGHVVMDVAYRMYPEVTLPVMVQDVFRAVAWMKEHASAYGVDPQRIVLGGGSAGGHLALTAAYTAGDESLVPAELAGRDLAVHGVVSFYGPADLRGILETAPRSGLFHPAGSRPAGESPLPRMMRGVNAARYQRYRTERLFQSISFVDLLGVEREEAAVLAEKLSPVARLHPGCPPTLLLQGEGDMLVPAEMARALAAGLEQNGTPVVCVMLPQTEHGFDLVLPAVSPCARAALYDLERFLALLACD